MKKWVTKSTEIVHETPWFQIVEDKVLNQKDRELTYTYLKKNSPSVSIVAVRDDGKVLLQHQYIYPVNKTLWVTPRGHCDKDSPLTAAKRELLEETGLESETWVDLGEFYLSTGIASILGYVYVAHNVKYTNKPSDEDEAINKQSFISTDELKQMLKSRVIVDGSSLISLYRYLNTVH